MVAVVVLLAMPFVLFGGRFLIRYARRRTSRAPSIRAQIEDFVILLSLVAVAGLGLAVAGVAGWTEPRTKYALIGLLWFVVNGALAAYTWWYGKYKLVNDLNAEDDEG